MALFDNYPVKLINGGDFSVKIIATDTLSEIMNLQGASLLGIRTDAAFTASAISFKVSLDGIVFLPLTDGQTGEILTFTVPASRHVRLIPADFVGAQFIQIETQIAQVSDTLIELVCGPLL